MKLIKIVFLFAIVIASCTNKNADYNNAIFDVHTEFQNNIKLLDDKLNTDSITNDSAIVYLANAQNNCKTQYALFKKIVPTNEALVFHNAVDSLLQKQLYTLAIQQKIYATNVTEEMISNLQDSLDICNVLVDSLDSKVKTAQVAFAKKNKFSLQ